MLYYCVMFGDTLYSIFVLLIIYLAITYGHFSFFWFLLCVKFIEDVENMVFSHTNL